MSRYSWIIFDADNTIFDFDGAERAALSRTLRTFGYECTDDVRRSYSAISARLWQAFEAGELTSQRLRVLRFEELLRELSPEAPGSAAAVSQRYIHELGTESCLLPSAATVVRDLRSNHRLLLATNGISEIQRRRFGGSVLKDCFEDVVISDEIGVAKPHAEFFDEAFRRMGDPAREHVLIVGDSLSSDIAGGVGYGIDTCWFDFRQAGGEAAIRHDPPLTPTYRISHLEELLQVLTSES